MSNEFCFLKDQNGGFHKVSFEDILFVKSLGNYLQFVTVHGAIVTLGALQSLESELKDTGHFARAHKSYVVNLEKIERLSAEGIFVGGQNLPIGAKFLDSIKKEFVFEHLLKL